MKKYSALTLSFFALYLAAFSGGFGGSRINGGGGFGAGFVFPSTPSKTYNSVLFTAASSQYIDLGNNFQFLPTDTFTISAWVYPKSAAGGFPVPFGNLGGGVGYELYYRGGRFSFSWLDGAGGNLEVQTPASYGLKHWYHVVVTYPGTNNANDIKVSVNGSLPAQTIAHNSSISAVPYTHTTRIGTDGVGDDWDGYIQDVSIWSSALGSSAITSFYNEGNPTNIAGSVGLTHWYGLGQGNDSGVKIFDRVGAIDGTVVNGASIKTFAAYALTSKFSQQIKNDPSSLAINGGSLFIPYYQNNNTDTGFDAPDLQIWNIAADPNTPSLTGTLPTTAVSIGTISPYFIQFKSNYGLLACFHNNTFIMNVVNLSNLASPSVATTVTQSDMVHAPHLELIGNYVYVMGTNFAGDTGKTVIIDVSSLPSASIVGSFATPYVPYGATQFGGRYLSISGDTTNRIKFFDVSSPLSPSLTATITPAANPPMYQLADGNNLYVGEGSSTGKLEVFNISTPGSPSSIATLSLSGGQPMYMALHSTRKLLFVPHLADGTIDVVSVYDPANPFVAETYSIGNSKNITAVALSGENLYVSSTIQPGGSAIDLNGYLDVLKL